MAMVAPGDLRHQLKSRLFYFCEGRRFILGSCSYCQLWSPIQALLAQLVTRCWSTLIFVETKTLEDLSSAFEDPGGNSACLKIFQWVFYTLWCFWQISRLGLSYLGQQATAVTIIATVNVELAILSQLLLPISTQTQNCFRYFEATQLEQLWNCPEKNLARSAIP